MRRVATRRASEPHLLEFLDRARGQLFRCWRTGLPEALRQLAEQVWISALAGRVGIDGGNERRRPAFASDVDRSIPGVPPELDRHLDGLAAPLALLHGWLLAHV